MLRKTLLLFLMCLSVNGQELEENDKCINKDEVQGICKNFSDCKEALSAVLNGGFHKLSRCGFRGFNEIICCPIQDSGQNNSSKGDREQNYNGEIPTMENGLNIGELVGGPGNRDSDQNFTSEKNQPSTAKPVEIKKVKRPAARACDRIIKGFVPPLQDHIIGGTDTTPGEFPHMAALGYPRVNKFAFLCGGSLISDRFVLTAAHCLGVIRKAGNRIATPTIVRLGTIIIEDGKYDQKLDYNISVILRHPEYKQFYHDIGLLKLHQQVLFNPNLHPACLPLTSVTPASMIITGWGIVNNEEKQRLANLQKATINHVKHEDCIAKYKPFKLDITDRMICALDKDGKDACQGDSGGPLQAITENDAHYRILGVVSFGHSCGTTVPGVYTRVYSFLDWIESVVWDGEEDLQIDPNDQV